MALRVIQECRRRNVDCIVAPYEADAQMAYLNKIGIADYIITEDSDLVLFGATKTIFKLDISAQGLLVDSSKLHLAMGCSENKYTFDKFRIMCILSGCDYLDSLYGIGLAKACKFVLLTAETDMTKALVKLPSYLNLKNVIVTKEYIDGFLKAEATFKHMFVFDPFKRSVVRLNDLPKDVDGINEMCSNAGVNDLDKESALNLALGNLNPFGLTKLDDFHPDIFKLKPPRKFESIIIAKHRSIWSENFKKHELKSVDDKTCAFQFNVVKKRKEKTKFTEDCEDDDEKDDDSSLVEMYAQHVQQEYVESESEESEKEDPINTKRNPFGKKVCSRSPLIEASSSLIKSLSPKKNPKKEPQPVREVRSRFFLPFMKMEIKTIRENDDRKSGSEDRDFIENMDDKFDEFSSNSNKRKGSNQSESSRKRSFIEEVQSEDENEINNNANHNNEKIVGDEEDVESTKLVACDSGLSMVSSLEEDEDVIIISEEKGDSKKPLNFLANAKKITAKQVCNFNFINANFINFYSIYRKCELSDSQSRKRKLTKLPINRKTKVH